MASLQSHPFRIYYSPADDPLNSFYIPALSANVRYDRSAGFFNSSALAVAAAGVARLIELSGLEKPAASHRSQSAATLSEGAKRYEQEEQRREQAEAERQRIQELEELAKHEDTTWSRVENLTEQKQAKPYEEAVALLVKLRDLAAYQDKIRGTLPHNIPPGVWDNVWDKTAQENARSGAHTPALRSAVLTIAWAAC